MRLLYPNQKQKAMTFSYDDGVTQDARLTEIFNRYKVKCTFNLNSQLSKEASVFNINDKKISRIPFDELYGLYDGHEIATHSSTHPHLETLTESCVFTEIYEDRKQLEKLAGLIVQGHAYPFGTYSSRVIKVLKNCGIKYARTVVSTDSFHLPDDFLQWHPTCHHDSPKLFDLLDKFLNDKYNPALFYIWGHSYEFYVKENWELIENFLEKASGHKEVWYATNIKIYNYVQAFFALETSADSSRVFNPSALDVCFLSGGTAYTVKSGETITI